MTKKIARRLDSFEFGSFIGQRLCPRLGRLHGLGHFGSTAATATVSIHRRGRHGGGDVDASGARGGTVVFRRRGLGGVRMRFGRGPVDVAFGIAFVFTFWGAK